MKTQTSYVSFFCWLCIFALIPGTLVFFFTNELKGYETLIPTAVVSIALIPFAFAFAIHKDLSSTNNLDGLTQNETARLKQITAKARKFVLASILVLFFVVTLVVIALVMISTIKANYLYTAIAALGGAELYVLMTLLFLQSNLGDFKTNIDNRKKDLEKKLKLKEKLNKNSDV